MNRFVFHCCFVALLLLSGLSAKAQKPKKVEVQNADVIYYNEKQKKDIQRLIGNVVFKHENAFLYCDSAYFNAKNNSLTAFSGVHLIDNDSIHLYSSELDYNGNTKVAQARNKVRLLQGESILTTDSLNFDRKTNIGYYFSGGKIVDKEHTITSILGYYYTNKDDFLAIDSVKVLNEDYTIDTDSLLFNTKTEISHFFGQTEIISDSTHIFAYFGRYDSQLRQSFLSNNALILSEDKKLKGDSIFYDEIRGIAYGFNNVSINDTAQKVMLCGDYLFYNDPQEEALVTKKALAIKYDGTDSLFMHSDTIALTRQIDTLWYTVPKDSLFQSPFEGREPDMQLLNDTTISYAYKDTLRFIKAYHHVQTFGKDLQSRCDSLIFIKKDSLLNLYGKPIIWSDNQQITAKEVSVKLQKERLETAFLKEKAFIIMQDDSIRFNQLSGNNMEAHFDTLGNFSRLDIFSDSKIVFFPREENKKDEHSEETLEKTNNNPQNNGDLIGVNISNGVDAKIWIKNNRPNRLMFYKSNNSVLNPIEYLPIEETRLKGFKWYEGYRPKNKTDIFIWKEIK